MRAIISSFDQALRHTLRQELALSSTYSQRCFSQDNPSSRWSNTCIWQTRVPRMSISQYRTFATTPTSYKQKHRDRGEATEEQPSQSKKGSSPVDAATISDALSLTALKTEISRIQDKLKKSLATLRPGGQFNPLFIETLRVDLSKLASNTTAQVPNTRSHAKETKVAWVKDDPTTHTPQPSQKTKPNQSRRKGFSAPSATATVPLRDIAQVIPRGGKSAIIMLNEEDFVKPVTSALLNSPYSLNPQPSPNNTLELIVPIPAPTAETRKLNVSQVDKYLERAENDLRDSRASMQKTFRTLQLNGQLRPDDHMKGSKDMEKVMDEAKAEIKRVCDTSRRALQ